MKKIVLIILSFTLTFFLTACVATMNWTGTGSVTIYVGDETTTCGPVTAIGDNDEDYTSSISERYSNLNRNVPGEYYTSYYISERDVANAREDYTSRCQYTVVSAINGHQNKTIIEGEEVDLLEGITARDLSNNNLTDDIEVTSDLDTSVPGDYTVTYSVETTDGGTKSASIIVSVVEAESDLIPEFDGLEDQTIFVGDTISLMEGVTSSDFEDGDLTDDITISGAVDNTTAGTYTITYTVMDSDDNEITETITVTVRTNTDPVITGAVDVSIYEGSSIGEFNSAINDNVVATDVEDGDITDDIDVDGPTDISQLGEYPITYTITDSDGNTDTISITMTIIVDNPPTIDGTEDITIYQGGTYDLTNGVSATDDKDGDITTSIVVDGTVDNTIVDTYTLTYSVTDSYGHTVTEDITITVLEDEAPMISGYSDFSMYQGETYDLSTGVTASDILDGDLTSSIMIDDTIDENTVDTYTVTYSVTDSYGNLTEETITVTVLEDEAPMISGYSDFSIDVDETYNLTTGVTASDTLDGDLTSSIMIDDTVDNTTPGTYIVTYSVTDSYGNLTEETITVSVNEAASPYTGAVVSADATEPFVINVAFDVDMFDNIAIDSSAFTFVVDGFSASITDSTIGLDSIAFTIDEIISLGSVVTMDYTATGTNDLTYGSLVVPDFMNQAVDTSNIGSGGGSYTGDVMVAAAFDANTIDIVFDVDSFDNFTLDESAFTVLIDDVETTITSSFINVDTVTLVITGTMDDFTFVEVSYNPTGTNDLTYGGVSIASFQDEPVMPPMGGGPMF